MSAPNETSTVQQFPCFSRLTEVEAAAVSRHLRLQTLEPDEVLFRQGDPGEVVYFLFSGQLEVTLEVAGGPSRSLAIIPAGSILGEMSFLLSEPRAATATVKTSVELATLDRAAFTGAMTRGEAWAQQFLFATAQTLARRLGTANHELGALIAATPRPPKTPTAKRLAADLEALRVKLSSEWSF